eukprot:PhM_4_TR8257/c0_g1_i1/m.49338/K14079/PAPD4, GLD2; poly(A) RNA polymerase GLD2
MFLRSRCRHATVPRLHYHNWGTAMLENVHRRVGNELTFNRVCKARAQLQHIATSWKSDAQIFLCGSCVTYGVMENNTDMDVCCLLKDVVTEKRAMGKLCGKLYTHTRDYFPKKTEHRLFDLVDCRVPVIKYQIPHSDDVMQHVLCEELTPEEEVLTRSCEIRFANMQVTREQINRYICSKLKTGKVVDFSIHEHNGGKGTRVHFEASDTTTALEIFGRLPDGAFITNRQRDEFERVQLSDDCVPELQRMAFDCSFMGYGIKNSYLLRAYMHSGPEYVRPAALAIKHWGKATTIGRGVHHYLTSYALNIMFVYFLLATRTVEWIDPFSMPHPMQMPRYPTYSPLPACCPEDVGRILHEYFKFYAGFNFEQEMVSLNRPRRSYRQDIGWDSSTMKDNYNYLFCIEDPYEHVHENGLNLGRHLTKVKLDKLKQEFQLAVDAIARYSSPDVSGDRALIGDRLYTGGKANKGKLSKREMMFDTLDAASGL